MQSRILTPSNGRMRSPFRNSVSRGYHSPSEEPTPMTVSIRQIHPVFVAARCRGSISPSRCRATRSPRSRRAWIATRCWCSATRRSPTSSRWRSAAISAPSRTRHGGNITKPEDRRLQIGMGDVSNLGKDGKPLPRDTRQRLFNLGNMLWHSDSSFRAIPAKYSLLSARVVNPDGRQHRVRRHAGGLRRARRRHQGARSRIWCASTR